MWSPDNRARVIYSPNKYRIVPHRHSRSNYLAETMKVALGAQETGYVSMTAFSEKSMKLRYVPIIWESSGFG